MLPASEPADLDVADVPVPSMTPMSSVAADAHVRLLVDSIGLPARLVKDHLLRAGLLSMPDHPSWVDEDALIHLDPVFAVAAVHGTARTTDPDRPAEVEGSAALAAVLGQEVRRQASRLPQRLRSLAPVTGARLLMTSLICAPTDLSDAAARALRDAVEQTVDHGGQHRVHAWLWAWTALWHTRSGYHAEACQAHQAEWQQWRDHDRAGSVHARWRAAAHYTAAGSRDVALGVHYQLTDDIAALPAPQSLRPMVLNSAAIAVHCLALGLPEHARRYLAIALGILCQPGPLGDPDTDPEVLVEIARLKTLEGHTWGTGRPEAARTCWWTARLVERHAIAHAATAVAVGAAAAPPREPPASPNTDLPLWTPPPARLVLPRVPVDLVGSALLHAGLAGGMVARPFTLPDLPALHVPTHGIPR